MKIIIKRKDDTAEYTIDTRDCTYLYAIKEAFRTAMILEGFTDSMADDVLGESMDSCNKKNDEAFDDD